MTKLHSTSRDAVLVAIDMSKHRQEVLLERPEGGRRRRMTVMATKGARQSAVLAAAYVPLPRPAGSGGPPNKIRG